LDLNLPPTGVFAIISAVYWTDEMRKTLAAAIDRIIPEDDYLGAFAAEAGDYIERILAGDLKHRASGFAEGLASLDAEANARFGQGFALLTAANQDTILSAVESGVVTTVWQTAPREFFRLLLELTAEGYYSDPGSGGNRGGVSWKMVGFDPKT
jgi:hypothetical protein